MLVLFDLVLSAAISWLLLRQLISHLRHSLLDYPNARSSHVEPTPRGGGIAFVVVTLFFAGIALLIGQGSDPVLIPFLAAPLALVGLLDDRYSLPVFFRYGVQLASALLILVFSPLTQHLVGAVADGSSPHLLILALLVFSATAVMNFTNFMDGLDGLVGGCMAVAISALFFSLNASWPLWSLVGSLLGFLFWNWSPAKIFMGDVGSTFLGAVFAGLVLQASNWPEAFGYLLVATPLLGDACFCVLRRLMVGQRVFQAHRLHLFQRLHQSGWPHARVSQTYIGATALLALAMLAGGLPWVFGLAVAELMLGVWLDQLVAVPFAVASKS